MSKQTAEIFKDAQEMLLAVLAHGEKETVYDPMQIQKILFLVDTEVGEKMGGPFYEFKPDDFGPADPNIYKDLKQLANDEYVEIVSGRGYPRYLISSTGIKRGRGVSRKLHPKVKNYIKEVIKWALSCTFPEMVSSVISKYPHMHLKSAFGN